MLKAVWFDIGGTIHTQKATRENDVAYAEEVFGFLKAHGIDTAQEPMELLAHINTGAKVYKAYSEEMLEELPTDKIWQQYILSDYGIPSEKIHGLGEELSYMYDRRRKVITPRVGLAETLEALKAAGYRLGVISNIMSRTFVPGILQEYGITDYFDYVIMSSEYGIRKPRRELFDAAAKLMGLGTNELAYVGDTISRDVRGAKNAGWKLMIQIDNPLVYAKDTQHRDCGVSADHHIKELGKIPDILQVYKTNGN